MDKSKIIIIVMGFIIIALSVSMIELKDIAIPFTDSPSVTNLNQAYDLFWSTGVYAGGNITHDAFGNVSISSGDAMLRTQNSHDSPLISVHFNAKNFTFNVDESGFIYLDYNNGNPILNKTSNFTSIDGDDQVTLYRIHRETEEIQYIDATRQNVDLSLKNRRMLYDIHRFDHAEGGAILGNPNGTLNVSVTAGKFYYGENPIVSTAHNTSLGDTFEYYYRNSSGGWNDTLSKSLNTSVYDSGTGTLTPMSPNKYKTSWVYLELQSDGMCHVAIVYGQNQYSTANAAQNDPIPYPLPASVDQMGVLIGRFIIQQGATSPTLTQTVFSPSIQFVNV